MLWKPESQSATTSNDTSWTWQWRRRRLELPLYGAAGSNKKSYQALWTIFCEGGRVRCRPCGPWKRTCRESFLLILDRWYFMVWWSSRTVKHSAFSSQIEQERDLSWWDDTICWMRYERGEQGRGGTQCKTSKLSLGSLCLEFWLQESVQALISALRHLGPVHSLCPPILHILYENSAYLLKCSILWMSDPSALCRYRCGR